jgi:acyl phosphate:glycerol-3-phosphate acyltransferase
VTVTDPGFLAAVPVAYAIGCISLGYYLGRRAGSDLRQTGSGSTGARNVARVVGRRAAMLALGFDVAKGAAAVGLADAASDSARVHGATAIAVVAGHIFPAQLRFRGGRGLATALGALAVLDWRLAAAGLAVALALAAILRVPTPAAVAGTAAAPITGVVIGTSRAAVGASLVCMLLIYAAYRRKPPPAAK